MIQEELHSPERASQIEIIIHDGIITSSRVIFTSVSEGETGPNEEDNTLCEIVCYNRIPERASTLLRIKKRNLLQQNPHINFNNIAAIEGKSIFAKGYVTSLEKKDNSTYDASLTVDATILKISFDTLPITTETLVKLDVQSESTATSDGKSEDDVDHSLNIFHTVDSTDLREESEKQKYPLITGQQTFVSVDQRMGITTHSVTTHVTSQPVEETEPVETTREKERNIEVSHHDIQVADQSEESARTPKNDKQDSQQGIEVVIENAPLVENFQESQEELCPVTQQKNVLNETLQEVHLEETQTEISPVEEIQQEPQEVQKELQEEGNQRDHGAIPQSGVEEVSSENLLIDETHKISRDSTNDNEVAGEASPTNLAIGDRTHEIGRDLTDNNEVAEEVPTANLAIDRTHKINQDLTDDNIPFEEVSSANISVEYTHEIIQEITNDNEVVEAVGRMKNREEVSPPVATKHNIVDDGLVSSTKELSVHEEIQSSITPTNSFPEIVQLQRREEESATVTIRDESLDVEHISAQNVIFTDKNETGPQEEDKLATLESDVAMFTGEERMILKEDILQGEEILSPQEMLTPEIEEAPEVQQKTNLPPLQELMQAQEQLFPFEYLRPMTQLTFEQTRLQNEAIPPLLFPYSEEQRCETAIEIDEQDERFTKRQRLEKSPSPQAPPQAPLQPSPPIQAIAFRPRRRRTSTPFIGPIFLRRSPRLMNKKRPQYFPPTKTRKYKKKQQTQ
ncbi:unnamed protein product [Mucor hiemalis]